LVIDYANFVGACGTSLTCVGSTVVNGNDLRLTPSTFGAAGAGFSTTAIGLGAGATFSTTFQFRMDRAAGIDPADGFTFVVSKASSGLGGAGGGLGYVGVGNSVAVEFDTYDNGEVGGSNHVAVDVNGSLNSLTTVSPYGVSDCHLANHLAAGCMSNGKIWSAFVNYDGTTKKLNVSVQETGSALIQLITDFSIDIAGALGTNDAFVGFTAATGAGYENHDILNWQLANDTSITPGNRLPEPASLALLSLAGVAAVAGARRRRQA
jgi:hypothetical protein